LHTANRYHYKTPALGAGVFFSIVGIIKAPSVL